LAVKEDAAVGRDPDGAVALAVLRPGLEGELAEDGDGHAVDEDLGEGLGVLAEDLDLLVEGLGLLAVAAGGVAGDGDVEDGEAVGGVAEDVLDDAADQVDVGDVAHVGVTSRVGDWVPFSAEWGSRGCWLAGWVGLWFGPFPPWLDAASLRVSASFRGSRRSALPCRLTSSGVLAWRVGLAWPLALLRAR